MDGDRNRKRTDKGLSFFSWIEYYSREMYGPTGCAVVVLVKREVQMLFA